MNLKTFSNRQLLFTLRLTTVVFLACHFGTGCKKPVKYQLCEKQGTMENYFYSDGMPYGGSVLDNSIVIAGLQYVPDTGLVATLLYALGEQYDGFDNVIPENISMYDSKYKEVYRYSPDEWIARLEKRASDQLAMIAIAGGLQSASAGLQQQRTTTYSSGNIYGSSGSQYYYSGSSSSYTTGNDPVAQQMALNRTNDQIISTAAFYSQNIENASQSLLISQTVLPGESYSGNVYFKNVSPAWLMLRVQFAGDTHLFVFRQNNETACEPESLPLETKIELELYHGLKSFKASINATTEEIEKGHVEEGQRILNEILDDLEIKYGRGYREQTAKNVAEKYRNSPMSQKTVDDQARAEWIKSQLDAEYKRLSELNSGEK